MYSRMRNTFRTTCKKYVLQYSPQVFLIFLLSSSPPREDSHTYCFYCHLLLNQDLSDLLAVEQKSRTCNAHYHQHCFH